MPKPRAYWIRLERGVHRKEKTILAARDLGISRHQLVGHLTELWLYMLEDRPTGEVTGMDDELIAIASGWSGNATKFVEVLSERKWIERGQRKRISEFLGDGVKIWPRFLSGWERSNGPALREYERKFRWNEKSSESASERASVRTTKRRGNDGLQNKTEHSPTGKKTPLRNVATLTADLISEYERITGWNAPKRTFGILKRKLEKGGAEIGNAISLAVDAYAIVVAGGVDKRFRILPYNFFGREDRWQEFTGSNPRGSDKAPDLVTAHGAVEAPRSASTDLFDRLSGDDAAGTDQRALASFCSSFVQANKIPLDGQIDDDQFRKAQDGWRATIS